MKKFKKLFLATVMTLGLSTLFNSAAFADDSVSPWKYWIGGGAIFMEHKDANEVGQLYEVRGSYDHNDRFTTELGVRGAPFLEGNDYNAPDEREGTYQGRNSPGENWFAGMDLVELYHLNDDQAKTWDPFVSIIGGLDVLGKRREGNNFNFYGGPGLGTAYWFNKDFALRADYNFLMVGDGLADVNHEAMVFAFYRFGGDETATSGEQNAGDATENLGATTTSGLSPVYFDFDKSVIKPDAQKTLQDNAAWMKSNASSKVSLEGHCDERGTNEYNMALGARRAKAAYDYLRTLGVDKDQMNTNSFGEEFPADPGHNEEAWRKNRRVESVVQH